MDGEARGRRDPATLLSGASSITLKVGSSLIVDAASGLRQEWMSTVAKDIADLRQTGTRVVLVSSGAVALGSRLLSLGNARKLDHKQAAAAVGQPMLMQAWKEALHHLAPTAQILLTLDDTESRKRWLNARATIEVLLKQQVLPIINENDTVATEELRYGDNDRLSARVAQMVRSDILILLSDVDGVYTADPTDNADARHVPQIDQITHEIEESATGPRASGPGSGGMRTKIAAAEIAWRFGCATIIASGRGEHPLQRIMSGEARSTVISATQTPTRAYKQWIAGMLAPAGALMIDKGAESALRSGKSLLPAGVSGVEGEFDRGACLRVLSPEGYEIARGITSYNSSETRSLLRCRSNSIEDRLGYGGSDEVIHRNDLVLM